MAEPEFSLDVFPGLSSITLPPGLWLAWQCDVSPPRCARCSWHHIFPVRTQCLSTHQASSNSLCDIRVSPQERPECVMTEKDEL